MYTLYLRACLLIAAVCALFSVIAVAHSDAQEDCPNIIWLTFEDTSEYELGCYGNPTTKTPNVELLAQSGIKFTQARAVAPYCSPSRSTLVTGTHATVFGTDWHRHNVEVPQNMFYWITLLRQKGYYCTNNVKTDYNARQGPEAWDECSPQATYNNPVRKPNQPFFAVFNNVSTHMSRLTTVTLEDRQPCRIDATKVILPPHVPDLPEIRADYALHLEGVEDIDQWVGVFQEDLKKRGLADNTIIFFFSDHGGCLPRGKAFPYESGFRVPFVVHIPPKWQHLSQDLDFSIGANSDRLIGFEDMGPTVLSLAGLETPKHMTGGAFLGKYATAPKKYQHCFRSNTGIHYDPVHTVTNGRFKYARCFTPYKAFGLRQAFQWQMPSQLAWDNASLNRTCDEKYRAYYLPKTMEMLFDLESDPYEMHDISRDSRYDSVLKELRAETLSWMKTNKDLSLIPAPFRWELSKGPLYKLVRETNYPLDELIDLAWAASEGNSGEEARFKAALKDPRPEFRFWGASGFATMALFKNMKNAVPELTAAMNEDVPTVAAVAAEALFRYEPNPDIIHVLLKNPSGASSMMSLLADNAAGTEIRNPILAKKDSKNFPKSDHYDFRSYLVSIGVLPITALYTPQDIKSGYDGYRQKLNWRKNLPNPLSPTRKGGL